MWKPTNALRELPIDFLAGFCLACAERGSGVFIALARPADSEWFSYALGAAWKVPTGKVNEDDFIEILEEFENEHWGKLGGSAVTVIRAGENEAVGHLQQLEQDAQNSFIESVRALIRDQEGSSIGEDFLEHLRESCAPIRDEIRAAAESVAELADWYQDSCQPSLK